MPTNQEISVKVDEIVDTIDDAFGLDGIDLLDAIADDLGIGVVDFVDRIANEIKARISG